MPAATAHFRPIFAAAVLGIASAPMMLAWADRAAAPEMAQREAHVELQAFQLKRVTAALAITERANAPGTAPDFVHSASPREPGYRWLLSNDVPSTPGMVLTAEPDPVQVSATSPVTPMGPEALSQ